MAPPKTSTLGIIVGYHRIPVDEQILEETVKLGFEHSFTKKCIEANRHNDATTTYNLLLKKFVREGGISKVYLGSKYFEASLIEPIRRVIPECKKYIIQQPSNLTRPHQISTLETHQQIKKTAAATQESDERPITWQTLLANSEISRKDKTQQIGITDSDSFILPATN